MKAKTRWTVIGVGMTTAMLWGGVAQAGPPDKACVAEVRAAGDWGKTLNPGKARFVAGTSGDDVIDYIAPDMVFCGLGGNDTVLVNEGWFYGGDDVDTVETNRGTIDGGADTDVVIANHGVFKGRSARDVVHVNLGMFDGGPGTDAVQDRNDGTCIDVEEGC